MKFPARMMTYDDEGNLLEDRIIGPGDWHLISGTGLVVYTTNLSSAEIGINVVARGSQPSPSFLDATGVYGLLFKVGLNALSMGLSRDNVARQIYNFVLMHSHKHLLQHHAGWDFMLELEKEKGVDHPYVGVLAHYRWWADRVIMGDNNAG